MLLTITIFRKKAIELAAERPLELPSTEEELKALVQELHIHQIELELQQQELMRARASAEYARDRYEDLYDWAPVGYLSLDHDDLIAQANLTATTLMGIDRADLINECFPRLIHPDDQDTWYYCQQAARNGQDDRPADLRVRTDEGSYRWMRVAIRADVGRADPQPGQGDGRLLLTLSDITERKADEQMLRTLNEQLRARTAELDARNAELHAIMDHLTQGLAVADLQGRVYQWNRASLEMHGLANVEEAQKQLEEFTESFELSTPTGEILPLEEWPLARVLRGETLRDLQLRVRHLKEGWERIWVYAGALVHDQEGAPFCAVVGITDITEEMRATEALREAKERAETEHRWLEAIMEALPIGMAITDDRGACIRTNDAYEKLWGAPRPPTESIDDYIDYRAWLADTGEPLLPEDWAAAQAVEKGLSVVNQFLRIQRFDGTQAYVLNSAAPVYDADGHVTGSAVAIQDITALRQAQEEVQSLARFPDESPDGILRIAQDGTLLYANAAGQTLLSGLPLVVGEPAPDILYQAATEAQSQQQRITVEIKHGQRVLSVAVAPFAVAGYTNLYARDVTVRKRTEEVLRQERVLLQTIYDSIPVMLTIYDPQVERITLNRHFVKVAGWTEEDTARTNVMELVYPDPEYRQEILEYMQSLQPGFRDIDMVTKAGEILHSSWANVVLPDGRQVGIGIDISERRRAEEVRRENERLLAQRLNKLQALYDVSQALLGRQHNGNVLRLICEAAVRHFGFCKAWIGLHQEDGQIWPAAVYGHDQGQLAKSLGLDPTSPVRPHVRSSVIDAIRAGQGQTVVDLQRAEELAESSRREALQRGVRSRAVLPIRIEGETLGAIVVYGGAPADTVAQEQLDSLQSLANLAALALQRAKLVERIANHAQSLEQTVAQRTEELARSEAHLRAIFDGAAIGIGVVDSEGYILSANPMMEEMLGHTALDLVGQKVTDYVSEDDIHAQRTQLVQLLAGKERLVRVSLQYRRGDGNLGWANVVVSHLPNQTGNRDRFVVMVEDTTEQRRTVAALLQSEKLAATGRLVAGLAHEINNPLQAVIGCLGLAQEVLAEGEDAESFLTIATEELHRAAKLVHDLYEIYRPGDERREPVDLNALVHRVVDLTRRQHEKGQIEVEMHLAEELPTVMAVPDRMQQVMLNLVLNAVDAMPEGGQLEICSSTSQDPESGRSGVRVEFHDNGAGVSPDVLEHLFEPFTTTKEEGSGLGLFVCRTILEQHGGSIRLESRQGEGTAAIVWLPC